MALIPCPECGEKVSASAPACPSCGYAVTKATSLKMRRIGCALFGIPFAILFIIAIESSNKSDNSDQQRAKVPLIGETWYVKGSSQIVCKDAADLDRLGEIARQKDEAAFNNFYLLRFIDRKCSSLKGGTEVYVEKVGLLDPPCVRPRGDPTCYYILQGALQDMLPVGKP